MINLFIRREKYEANLKDSFFPVCQSRSNDPLIFQFSSFEFIATKMLLNFLLQGQTHSLQDDSKKTLLTFTRGVIIMFIFFVMIPSRTNQSFRTTVLTTESLHWYNCNLSWKAQNVLVFASRRGTYFVLNGGFPDASDLFVSGAPSGERKKAKRPAENPWKKSGCTREYSKVSCAYEGM
jgi:hypothetical protein